MAVLKMSVTAGAADALRRKGGRFEGWSYSGVRRALLKERILEEIAKLNEAKTVESLHDRLTDILETMLELDAK